MYIVFKINSFLKTVMQSHGLGTGHKPVHKPSSYLLPAPPALKLSVNETYVVDPGQDVTMSCEVTAGFPMPTVTWARYPGPLPRRATIRGGSLTLRSVTPAESGFYNCTAVNNVGNPARRNVNLVVRSMCTTYIDHNAYIYLWFRVNFLPDIYSC